jgi:hypothetical protein
VDACARLVSLASWQLLVPILIFLKNRNLQRFAFEKTCQLMASSYYTWQGPATNTRRKISPKDGTVKINNMKISTMKQMNASCVAKFARKGTKLGHHSKLTFTTHPAFSNKITDVKNELSVIQI